jgi:hypothetical protein
MRVLIANEESYRSYGEVLQRAIRLLRPHSEVSLVQTRELSDEVEPGSNGRVLQA